MLTKKSSLILVVGASVAVALSGCGGGGGGSTSMTPITTVTPPVDDVTVALPGGHGLATGEITVAPGAMQEHGNVVVSCPTGGAACVLTVAADGTATYDRTGGMPSFTAAQGSHELPGGHGLATGEITVAPGAMQEHGNVVVSCPTGGAACVLTVAADGTATYDRTGGMPSFTAAQGSHELPGGHGLATGEITVAPGAMQEHGNVVVSCPTGGAACVLTVAADGTATYDRTGGMPSFTAAQGSHELPGGHGLATGEITVAPGAMQEHGNVVVSCPTGGAACVLTVAADGTATYDRTGGMPSFTAAQGSHELPGGHGLATGEITVAPGAMQEHGNVVVSCPTGGAACVLTVAADGTATYDRTGGMPSFTAAQGSHELPGGHGLATGEITVAPGAMQEHGNVVVSCPTGGAACVLTVAADGTATYDRTGGMPSFTAAQGSHELPGGHGLATGEITVAPGAMQEHGNVVVSCPTGGAACVLTVAADGTATYDRTGGMPSFTAAQGSHELPGGHGLATGEITVAPGAMQEHGNVVVSCPTGGAACVLTVAADGTATYDRTGGMPSFTAAQGSHELPGGHGLATGEITVAPGAMQEHGNVVVSCPTGGAACVLTVAADGTATYDRTGGMPSFTAAQGSHELPGGHGLATGEITVAPGAMQEHGNVVVSCPTGGAACVLTVAADGTATYDRTGGMPSFTAAQGSHELPGGHGLATGEITVAPGAMQEHGNVVVSCPTGGAACVLTVAADGTATYDRTGGMPSVATITPMTLAVSVFEGAVNADLVTAANIITAIGKAAQAKPLPGSVTQSSNVDIGGITTDQIEVTVQYGATGPSFWVGDGRDTYEAEWWIDMGMGEGNPRPVANLDPPWEGVHLSKYLPSYSHREGGRLYVDVYSDIEAPSTETVSGVPQDVQMGDVTVGLSCFGPSCAPLQGTLNGVPGTFTCPSACGIRFVGVAPYIAYSGMLDLTGANIVGVGTLGIDPFPVEAAAGIVFTPESTTQTVIDADYLSLGTWLFVPDDAARAANYVFGAFADGSDPFIQSNLTAVQGTASYDGNATGVYSEKTGGSTEIGDFDGDVRLTANFGARNDLGTISGSITNFEVDGVPEDGTLNLGTGNIGSQNSGFFRGSVTGSDDERSYTGYWGGQFFGNGESDGRPGSVVGTFGGHSTDDAVNFVGAFGAHKQ